MTTLHLCIDILTYLSLCYLFYENQRLRSNLVGSLRSIDQIVDLNHQLKEALGRKTP